MKLTHNITFWNNITDYNIPMSWGMPNMSPWGAPMGMAPNMTMGSFTPEQWAALQQQNWNQWAQWHQQYAQWQSQYGEKYAEQMQAMQAVGKLPPLPPANTAPPPAPPAPPPDQPPPPPHENNQPLFGQGGGIGKNQAQPAPVPAPHQNQHRNMDNFSNANTPTINHNRLNQSDTNKGSKSDADPLKKLDEEEKLFDVQYEKWEQEIEKWRQDNVNHPDKESYLEYEKKFESCRAQLLERRRQMKLKKAKLLGHGTQQPPTLITPNTTTTSMPIQSNYNQNSYDHSAMPQNYQNQHQQAQNYMPHNNLLYQNHQQVTQPILNSNSNKNIDPQDRYESYTNRNESTTNYGFQGGPPPVTGSNSEFLPKGTFAKGIPGLDLVPEVDKKLLTVPKSAVDLVDDNEEGSQPSGYKLPDYSTISKGINNILGDEKIMHILSMVQGNNRSLQPSAIQNAQQENQQNDLYNNNNFTLNKTQDRYKDNFKEQEKYQDNFKQQDRYQGSFKDQDRYQENFNNEEQNNRPYDRQNQNYHVPQNQDNYIHQEQNYRQNVPYNKQDQNYLGQPSIDFNPKFPPPKRILDERRPDNIKLDQPFNRGFQPSATNVQPPAFDGAPVRPYPGLLMPPDGQQKKIPALLDLPGPCNNNAFSRDLEIKVDSQPPPRNNTLTPVDQQSSTPKWVEEPLFMPSIIVEYEHKPLRLKARDFIEPVHIFEYNHKSKNEESRQKDFEKEAQELFVRKPRRDRDDEYVSSHKYRADFYNRDFERRVSKDDLRNEIRTRLPPREDFERRRFDDRFDDRRRDDRDRYVRRDEFRDIRDDKDRDRDRDKDRLRDMRRERNSSGSRDRDIRKRGHSRESSNNYTTIKKTKESVETPSPPIEEVKHVVMIDDLLEEPGRAIRPEKIVIILRGPPGSGKSYLAKLIRDKEAEHGGTARIMSIDDYFMQEGEIEEKDPTTGRIIKKPTLKYEYDKNLEETYQNSLKRAFKRSLTDGYFSFLIFDAVNSLLKHYADVWNNARQSGFQVYICTMDLDPHVCFKRNIHNRTLEEIQEITSEFFTTPAHHIQLDATTLLQSAAIPDVTMEDVVEEVEMEDAEEPEVESTFVSKWETMDDAVQLARLDGISKPLRSSQLSMEDYLQLDDWTPTTAKPGKKTVRWADIEERRQQEKMRAIGFVVGQTDWNRMTDPTMGSSALTQTKYIERVRRN